MNSRVILNIFLLLLVLTLVAIAYFQPGVEKAEKPASLLSLDPSQVNRISITPAEKHGITFERYGAGWRIKDPIDTRANNFRIDTLLQLARTPVRKQFDVAQSDISKFKLDKPAGNIRFNDIDIAFGDIDPINNYRYVMIADKVFMIADNYFHYLQFDLANYVDNHLLPPDSHLTAIELPDLVIKAQDNGQWSVSPEHPDLPADAVRSLMDEWRNVQALQVSRNHGDKVTGNIRITLDNRPAPLEFQILEREPDLILGREDIGMRYHISGDQAERLMKLAPENQQSQADTSAK